MKNENGSVSVPRIPYRKRGGRFRFGESVRGQPVAEVRNKLGDRPRNGPTNRAEYFV